MSTIIYQENNINQLYKDIDDLEEKTQELEQETQHLQQEINNIPVPPAPRTIPPVDITLNFANKSAGSSNEYARGDHVHYLDLSLPIKFFNLNRFTPYFIINYTMEINGPSTNAIYIKFPFGTVGFCEIKSSVFYFNESTSPAKFDSSQIFIKMRTAGCVLVTIETELSHAVLNFSTANVIYTTIDGEVCYYVKIPYNLSTNYDNIYIKYHDCSGSSTLMDEFTLNNMLRNNVPLETTLSNIIKVYPLAE
jgi:hypothetical protein